MGRGGKLPGWEGCSYPQVPLHRWFNLSSPRVASPSIALAGAGRKQQSYGIRTYSWILVTNGWELPQGSEQISSCMLVGAGQCHCAMGRASNCCLGGDVSITTTAAGVAAKGWRLRLTTSSVKGWTSEKPEYTVEKTLLINLSITNGNHLFILQFVLRGSSF